ncbi:MAG TPA: hotdog domain-containing protein [Acidimicrobiales bacterium]|nr:hotdog domain-containing protein [Acidimicrobiales bacterium]
MPISIGLRHEVSLTVADADTAVAFGTGEVAVLSTPRVVALCEEAALRAVARELEPGQTTVSSRVELSHVTPVAVGVTVRAEATLERVEGRRLIFAVSLADSRGLVAAGRVTRVVVETDRFLKRAQ